MEDRGAACIIVCLSFLASSQQQVILFFRCNLSYGTVSSILLLPMPMIKIQLALAEARQDLRKSGSPVLSILRSYT